MDFDYLFACSLVRPLYALQLRRMPFFLLLFRRLASIVVVIVRLFCLFRPWWVIVMAVFNYSTEAPKHRAHTTMKSRPLMRAAYQIIYSICVAGCCCCFSSLLSCASRLFFLAILHQFCEMKQTQTWHFFRCPLSWRKTKIRRKTKSTREHRNVKTERKKKINKHKKNKSK